MSKNVLIISVAIIAFLSIGTIIGITMNEGSKYNLKLQGIVSDKNDTQTQINKLKADKDANGFLPSDVVTFFLNEDKSGSFDKAKLYVSKTQQSKDITAWLSLGKPLSSLSPQDVNYTITDDTASVQASIEFDNVPEFSVSKIFSLVKEDSVWKIADIKGA